MEIKTTNQIAELNEMLALDNQFNLLEFKWINYEEMMDFIDENIKQYEPEHKSDFYEDGYWQCLKDIKEKLTHK